MDNKLVECFSEQVNAEQLSPLIWAYVGDAVYELYVRVKLLAGGHFTPHNIHTKVVQFVKAAKQASLLEELNEYLNEREQNIVRRGRNVKSNVPKSTDMITYRHSTGFEALIGYLYLSGDHERLWDLLEKIGIGVD